MVTIYRRHSTDQFSVCVKAEDPDEAEKKVRAKYGTTQCDLEVKEITWVE